MSRDSSSIGCTALDLAEQRGLYSEAGVAEAGMRVWMKRRALEMVGLIAAALTLSGGRAAVAQHGYTRAEVENGPHLCQASCATCHGPQGDTVRGVALFGGQFRRATTDDQLVRMITGGIPGSDAGILTTASDVLVSGGGEGFVYAIGGRQYVAIAAGNSLYAYALKP